MKNFLQLGRLEAGCDEAGRGCLAGPVFAAAVILPPLFFDEDLNDSKQLTLEQRLRLRRVIEEKALAYCVASLNQKQIDKYNILNASIRAMHKAVAGLTLLPEHLLIDGNRFLPYKNIDHTCVIKGDATYASIAAASVLAKTYRDDFMIKWHKKFPVYNWESNKGYPTSEHRKAIIQHGPCKMHRQSFRLYPLPMQSTLFND